MKYEFRTFRGSSLRLSWRCRAVLAEGPIRFVVREGEIVVALESGLIGDGSTRAEGRKKTRQHRHRNLVRRNRNGRISLVEAVLFVILAMPFELEAVFEQVLQHFEKLPFGCAQIFRFGLNVEPLIAADHPVRRVMKHGHAVELPGDSDQMAEAAGRNDAAPERNVAIFTTGYCVASPAAATNAVGSRGAGANRRCFEDQAWSAGRGLRRRREQSAAIERNRRNMSNSYTAEKTGR